MDFEGCSSTRARVPPKVWELIRELNALDEIHGTELAAIYKRTTRGFIFYHEDTPAEFIVVSRGCPFRCTYCVIPKGRGIYSSVPVENILGRARRAIEAGRRKIYLLGDEVGSYGMDGAGVKIPELLSCVLALDDQLTIGIRYIEPMSLLKHFGPIMEHCQRGRITFLYVPLQSGSPEVLKDMNRRYVLTELAEKMRALRRETGVVLYTNWMVGFPSESDNDFRATVELLEHLEIHVNAIIPFSARPGTRAAAMSSRVGSAAIRERRLILHEAATRLKIALLEEQSGALPTVDRERVVRLIGSAEQDAFDAQLVGDEG